MLVEIYCYELLGFKDGEFGGEVEGCVVDMYFRCSVILNFIKIIRGV